MYCKNCGKEIDDNAIICIHCGVSTKAGSAAAGTGEDGSIGCLLGGVCFLFPIVGLILYLVWKDTMPVKAKDAGKWALIAFGVSFLFWLICFIGFAAVASEIY